MKGGVTMGVFAEQFIKSDKSYDLVNFIKKGYIALAVLAGIFIKININVSGFFLLFAAMLFVTNRYIYFDFEYEYLDGRFNVSKIYNKSRRKLVINIGDDEILKIYKEKNNGTKIYKFYTTSAGNLPKYVVETNRGRKFSVALNGEMEKIFKMNYRSKFLSGGEINLL